MITIYGNNNAIVYKGNAIVTYKGRLMGEQTLTVSIVSKDVIPFAFGCYADTEIERFYLYQVPTQTINESYIEYTLVMESAKYELIRAEMLSFGASEYSLITTMQGWLQLLCENVNRVVGGGWSYQINDANEEYKTLEITGENTLAALNRVNSDFGKEFYVQGKVIYVGKRGVTHSLTLSVGRWKGLYNLTLEGISNQNPITRLYLYGSEKNLPSNYQNADGKPITKRLVVDAVNGGNRYIDSPNIAKFGVNEGRKTFDDVWPHRTGTVTTVTDNLTFTDSSIDFDINAQLISGTSCKLQFKTGDLAGYDFELVSYNHTNKVIKIKSITDSTGLSIPNDTIKIKVDDKYVLFDLIMPQIYITNAETDLKAKGVDWLVNQKNDDYQVKYTANSLDLAFCRDNGFTPFEGDYVPIKDARLGINRLIRIVEVNIDLSGPYKDYKSVELSDNIEPTAAQQFVQDNVSRDTLIKVNDKRRRDDIRRGWSAMDELRENIFDQSGYFDTTKIKPASVDTGLLTVGAKESRMTLNGVTILANYLAAPNDLRIIGGTLYHFTIPDATGHEWIVSNGVTSLADNNYRHIYARCSKGDNTASIVFDTQKLAIDGDGYYYFLIGGLSSVVDGVRRINLTYGQGSIVGEQLNIGKINDPQGREFLNINERRVKGAITFEGGSSGLENLAEWSAKQVQINNAQTAATAALQSANTANNSVSNLNNYVDGAFKDGVVSEAEAAAIDKLNKQINSEFDRAIADYNSVYTNTYLVGAAKADLLNSKINLVAAKDALQASINTAIADGKTTAAEKADVDNKFASYKNAFTDYQAKLSNAGKAVQVELDRLAGVKIDGLQVGVKNVLLSSDFSNLTKWTIDNAIIQYGIIPNAAVFGGKYFFIQNNTNDWKSIKQKIKVTKNANYIINGQINVFIGTNSVQVVIQNEQENNNIILNNYNQTDTFIDYALKFNSGDNEYVWLKIWTTGASIANRGYLGITPIVLAVGTKVASDWIVAQDEVKSDVDAANATANAANNAVNSLNRYVDGAFKDGVVSEAEAAAIDKLNKQINSEFDRAIADYNTVYTNTYLVGSAKSDLLNSKINLVAAKDALQSSINIAIADGKTTAAEKADVDSKFVSYKNGFTDYQAKLSNAGKAVQMELDRLAGVKVDALDIGGSNLALNSSAQISNLNYNIANYNLSQDLTAGETYTATVWGNLYSGKSDFAIFMGGGYTSCGAFQKINNGVYKITFIAPTTISGNALRNQVNIYATPYSETGISTINKFKLEKGNKGTDYSRSDMDTQADINTANIAAATAQADAITAKARTEGFSGFNGGVGFANLFKLIPTGATKETAGMSGQTVDANGNSLPAFFTGGNFAEAIAGICNLIFKHNGDAKFGDFYVDSSGSICIKEGNVNRVILTRGVISSLSQLFGASTSGGVSNASNTYNQIGDTNVILPNYLQVANNNTTVTIAATLTATAIDGSSTITVYLKNTTSGVETLIDQCYVLAGKSQISKSTNINKSLLVASGSYALKVYYSNTTDTNGSASATISQSTMSWTYQATAQRMEIGRNGFAVISDIYNFIYAALESDGFKVMIRGTGNKIDLPGVLLAGKGLASGGFLSSRIWGSKSAGVSIARQSVGYYRLYHYLGHSRYSATATACSTYQGSALTAYISAETDTYIDITILQGSTPRDSDFNFNISGNNQ